MSSWILVGFVSSVPHCEFQALLNFLVWIHSCLYNVGTLKPKQFSKKEEGLHHSSFTPTWQIRNFSSRKYVPGERQRMFMPNCTAWDAPSCRPLTPALSLSHPFCRQWLKLTILGVYIKLTSTTRILGQQTKVKTESKSRKQQEEYWKKSDFTWCRIIPSDREGGENWTILLAFSPPGRPIYLFLYDLIIISRQSIRLCLFKCLEALRDLHYLGCLRFSAVSEVYQVLKSPYHWKSF